MGVLKVVWLKAFACQIFDTESEASFGGLKTSWQGTEHANYLAALSETDDSGMAGGGQSTGPGGRLAVTIFSSLRFEASFVAVTCKSLEFRIRGPAKITGTTAQRAQLHRLVLKLFYDQDYLIGHRPLRFQVSCRESYTPYCPFAVVDVMICRAPR